MNDAGGVRSFGIAEVALMLGVSMAVLAFGGMEPVSFAVVEVLFFGAAVLIVGSSRGFVSVQRLKGFTLPAILVGVVLIQLCPLTKFTLQSGAHATEAPFWPHLKTLTLSPYNTRGQFLILLTCVIAFYLAQIVACERKQKQRLIAFLIALGIFEALYGLVQYLSGRHEIFGYVKRYDLEEATGTYINRNHFAGLLEMVIPLALALLLYEYGKMRKSGHGRLPSLRRRASQDTSPKFIFLLFATVLLFAALILSRSRMGIIASSAGILLVFGFSFFRRKTGLALPLAFVALSLCLVGWMGARTIVGRFAAVGQEYTFSGESRASIWKGTAALIWHHPLLGTGFGTFPIAYTEVQTTFLGQFVNHAHNDYLEIGSDLGAPVALCFFLSIFLVAIHASRKFLREGGGFDRAVGLGCLGSITVILLHSIADFNLYIPANALLFSVILGIAFSESRRNKRPESVESAA